jgi:SprT-like family
MARITPELTQQIVRWSKKYNEMLCTASSCPMPEYEILNNVGSAWLGRAKWWVSNPLRTVIQFQKRILEDPKTFERIFAHEWIHHVNYMNFTPKDYAYIRAGIKQDGHGSEFLKYAAMINAKMGEGYVSPTSDESYVQAQSGKTLQVFIAKFLVNRLGWSWAVKISPKMATWLFRRLILGNAKLIEVKDDFWTTGPKLDGSGKLAVPNKPEEKEKLQALYDAAPEFDPKTVGIRLGILPSRPA